MPLESLRQVIDEQSLAASPTLFATASVASAIALVKERQLDAVIVMDDDRCAGLFTTQHALSCLADTARDPGKTLLAEVLTRDAPSVDIDTSVERALGLMDRLRCHHVVVSARGRLLGLLSRHTLTAWIIRNQQEQLDGAIRAVMQMGYSNRRG